MVELDGEAVVFDDESCRLYLLNPVATVVWQCLDGTASVPELAAELAGSFGAPVATVRADVEALVVELAGAGLLEGSAIPPEERYAGPVVGGRAGGQA
ncbi:MAG: PqqD family protein [Acidimicrobiales bacterium]